ncbi:hypothetical protein Q5752_004507 [Cryptotrichosporon argae]
MPAIVITPLCDPVAVVQLPLELTGAELYTSRLFWTIDTASTGRCEFFNYTSNDIEITLFASLDLIDAEWRIDDTSVRVSASWRVFEISSGDIGENGNYDSPHLRHVSAPLAEAGITILYQSSYYTDFLLVKETDFVKASKIFASHGWHVEPELPLGRSASVPSPLSPLSASACPPHPPLPTPPLDPCPLPHLYGSPSLSPIPPTPEITVLPSALSCVGFSAERDVSEKINKLLVWPHRMYPAEPASPAADTSATRPFISYTRTQDGCSLLTDASVIRRLFPDDAECGSAYDDAEWDDLEASDNESEETSAGPSARSEHPDVPVSVDDYEIDLAESASEYAARYRGATKVAATAMPPVPHVPSITIPPRSSASSLRSLMHPATPPDIHVPFHYAPPRVPPTPTTPGLQSTFAAAAPKTRTGKARWSLPMTTRDNQPSSPLHTDNHQERGRSRRRTTTHDFVPLATPYSAPALMQPGTGSGTKRCLQLDLRGIGDGIDADGAYHLDKSGLVTLFATLLGRAHIRMLYSSTFHTANILVQASDVRRAGKVLGGRAAPPSPSLPELSESAPGQSEHGRGGHDIARAATDAAHEQDEGLGAVVADADPALALSVQGPSGSQPGPCV